MAELMKPKECPESLYQGEGACVVFKSIFPDKIKEHLQQNNRESYRKYFSVGGNAKL